MTSGESAIRRSIRLAAFGSTIIAIMLFASFHAVMFSAVPGGNDNYSMIPVNSTGESVSYSISTTITASNGYQGPAPYCSVKSQWSDQWNTVDASDLGNAWIQSAVEVDPAGNSCFVIEYWPSYYGNTYYSYAFSIGYSSEFYKANYGATFSWTASNWKVSAFKVHVASDTWAIYPSNLCYGSQCNPTIKYDSYSGADFVFVGCCNLLSSTFTAGAGTITYNQVTTIGTDGSYTGENSNMGYGGINEVNQYTWDQSFTG